MIKRHPQSDIVWSELRNSNCSLCSLHETAQSICLLGDGPVPAEGMIIGEAPGNREEQQEIPFSGKSGKLLRDTLTEIDLPPGTLFITNVVACRPPANRTPSRSEAKTCSSTYLTRQIEMVKPRVILVLGNTALAFALGKKGSITKVEGNTFTSNGITYVPVRHPSSIIRREGEDDYKYLVNQFKQHLLLFKRTLFPKDDGFRFSQKFPEFKEGPVYVDIETNGLNPFRKDAVIHCAAVAQDPEKVHCSKLTPDHPKMIDRFKEIIEKHPIMAQRGTFEGTWIHEKFGVTPRIYFDTKLASYLIDENDESGLKYQAIKHLGIEPWSEEQDFQNPDFSKMLPYNARDTAYGLRLYKERDLPYFKKYPKQARLMKYILLPAEEVFTEVICNGFHIDEKLARERLDKCKNEKEIINQRINEMAGREINPGSSKQVADLLYKDLGLTCPIKTPKGANSSSEAALIRIEGSHKVLDDILEWRKWQKFDSTYLTPWLEKGPILHANYGFTDTDTGRLNSTMVKNKRHEKGAGATLHQCPRDPFIRNIITARDSDWCIVAADLSQIELRLVAHAANEPTMMEIFNNDEDIHLATAQSLKRGPIDKETRKRAKAVNFGFVYGMYPDKFVAYAKEKFGLNLTLREGKIYREEFFEKYSGLLPWHNRVEAFVSQNGWIDSVFGRRRHLPLAQYESGAEEWLRRRTVRQGINSPIQGAASDLDLFIVALIASYSLNWDFKINRKKVITVGAAHDSLIFECHRRYVPEFREGILYTLNNLPTEKYFGFKFKVPIRMDVVAYQKYWEGEELK